MNRLPKLLLLLLLLTVVSSSGYRHYHTQARLARQLQQLDQVLNIQNNDAAVTASGMVKGINAAVIKNQLQPRGVALLHRAEALELRTRQLLDTLNACRELLCRATGDSDNGAALRHPGETRAVAQLLGSGTRRQLALQQQLATYTDTVRQFRGVHPASFPPATFENMSAVEALAALTELQSAILDATNAALRHLAATIGAGRLSPQLLAVAPAESNVVAPGETYHARLLLLKSLPARNLKMYCDGRPVTVGSNGVGHVRFHASTRPGPAFWTATIQLHQYGRTTFRVRVPYRVAGR